MVEGGMTCIKYLLFAFNLLFFIAGLTLIICGAVIEGAFKEYFEIIGGRFNAAAVLLISVGIIIFIIGFFGCCGAVKENHCMVMTFAVLLLVIFILELAAGITGFVMRGDVKDVVSKSLETSQGKYESAKATQKGWDALQHNLECCGVKSYADWEDKLNGTLKYPKSCCKEADQSKGACGQIPGLAYKDGCVKKLDAFVSDNVLWIGVIGLVLSFIQIIGVIFACCLARTIKKEYEVV